MAHIAGRKGQAEHRESLKGNLAPFVTRDIPSSAEFAEAKERAWHSAAEERLGRQRGQSERSRRLPQNTGQ